MENSIIKMNKHFFLDILINSILINFISDIKKPQNKAWGFSIY